MARPRPTKPPVNQETQAELGSQTTPQPINFTDAHSHLISEFNDIAPDAEVQPDVESFLATLSPDDQSLFKATQLAEQLLQGVQDDEAIVKKDSISRRVFKALKPFIAGVEQYGQAWDCLAQTNSMCLPIWGATRVLLKWASEFADYFDNLADMFESIGLILTTIKRYPRLYPDNPVLRTAMVDVFRAIFAFLTKATEEYRKAKKSYGSRRFGATGLKIGLKLFGKPFKVQFGGITDRIKAAAKRIDTEVDVAEKELAYLERAKAEKERSAAAAARSRSERENYQTAAALAVTTQAVHALTLHLDEENAAKVNRWLAPVNVAGNHNIASRVRHASSGSWFLDSPAFQRWLTKSHRFLWLYAIPGAGKTVLASTIINFLSKYTQKKFRHRSSAVVYFYCDYRDSQKQQPLKILSTILSMLSVQNRDCFTRIQDFCEDQYRQNPAYEVSFDDLADNFFFFIRDCFDEIFIVIDALDECKDRDVLLPALTKAVGASSNVRILVTSRYEMDIVKAFEELPRVMVGERDVASDIEHFVQFQISTRIAHRKLKLRDAGLEQVIVSRLVDGAKGMFQWVKCQIDQLCKLKNDKAIRAALDNLPKDLNETYLRILQRVKDEDDVDVMKAVERLLRWLVKSVRNLTLDELAECVSIDFNGAATSMDFDAVATDAEDTLEWCSSLITVSADKSVSLAHHSAKEYLESTELRNKLPEFWAGGAEGDLIVASVCLEYLCYDDFSHKSMLERAALQATLDRYKMLDYAAKSWATHAARVSSAHAQSESLTRRILSLFNTYQSEEYHNFRLWKLVYFHKQSTRDPLLVVSTFDPLSFASYAGLPRVVHSLLPSDRSGHHGQALRFASAAGHVEVIQVYLDDLSSGQRPDLGPSCYIASARGHLDVLKLLLANANSDVNQTMGKEGTCLQVAALEGHDKVCQYLLEQGAVAKPFHRWGTALAAAAEKGHLNTVHALLDHGVDLNARGGWYAYPLTSAIVGRNLEVVKLLIARGADVNAQGGRYSTALIAASSFGWTAAVQLLLAAGASVNLKDDKGADALYSVCLSSTSLECVNILLEAGADVNAMGGRYNCALNAACVRGDTQIIDKLLLAGADITICDDIAGSPIQIAAWHGNVDAVRALVAAGCDIDCDEGRRGTPLMCAATNGHCDVIRLLYEELELTRGDTQQFVNAWVFAANGGHEDVVELMMDKDLTGFSEESFEGESSMRIPPSRRILEAAASVRGNANMVKLLIDNGADVNSTDRETSLGFPLLAACMTGTPDLDVIHVLLDANADVNLYVESTEFPTNSWALAAATYYECLEVVQLLIQRGAYIDLQHDIYPTALQLSVTQSDLTIFNFLISNGANVNISPEFEEGRMRSPLQEAAKRGDCDLIRRLVVDLGANLKVDGDKTPYVDALQVAAAEGNLEAVQLLVELGSDLNSIGGDFETCLIAAASRGHLEVARYLNGRGADPNLVSPHSKGKYSALSMAAVEPSDTSMMRLLIECGADVNLRRPGELPYSLFVAVEEDSDEAVEVLLELDADVNVLGGRWWTALQIAAKNGNSNIMTMLLRAGANVNLQSGGQLGTALIAAYSGKQASVIDLLHTAKADCSIVGGVRWYHSAMGAAIAGSYAYLISELATEYFDLNMPYGRNGYALQHLCVDRILREPWLLDTFLDAGADPNAVGGFFGSALTAAVTNRRSDSVERCVRVLLKRGADPTRGTERFPNALYGLVYGRWNHTGLLKEFYLRGCDIHTPSHRGPLVQCAIESRNPNMARQLIAWGASPAAHPEYRFGCALQAAIIARDRQMIRFLLRRGCKVNVRGGRLGSPLHAAAIHCLKLDMELILGRSEADPNMRAGRYAFPLQAAALCGYANVMLLLGRGAKIDAVGGKYGTALQAAVVSGNQITVEILLRFGANPNLEGGSYGTALQAAFCFANYEIARILIDAGATVQPVNRQNLGHLEPSRVEDASRMYESSQLTGFNEDDDSTTTSGEDSDASSETSWESVMEEDTSDDESGDSQTVDTMLFLNVDSIPGFDEPYEQSAVSKDETAIEDDTAFEPVAPRRAETLLREFHSEITDVFDSDDE